jgi:predicted nuclease with TOPRIM domain
VNAGFEYTTALQYKVKALSGKVADFESGERYVRLNLEFKKRLKAKDTEIARLKNELAEAHSRTVTVRRNWSEVFDDLEKEHRAQIDAKDRRIRKLIPALAGSFYLSSGLGSEL